MTELFLFAILALALVYGITLFGIPLYFAHRRRQRLAASGIADIDRMDGKEFEQYLEGLFQRFDYKVERTRYVGDYGADLVLRKGDVKTVVQAKRYSKAVGIKAVQEAVAAKGMYGCTEAMVVTNSTFTRAAVELARANRVVLWDRTRLVDELLRLKGDARQCNVQAQVLPAEVSVHSSAGPDRLTCVLCESTVSEKVGQFCLSQPERFGGSVYCFEHQKSVRRIA